MKTAVIVLLTTMLVGCATRPAPAESRYQHPEHSIKMMLSELAITERSVVDSARRPYNGVLDSKSHADSFLPAIHAEWSRITTGIRAGTFTGTEQWSAEKKEEVICYGLRQRELLSLEKMK